MDELGQRISKLSRFLPLTESNAEAFLGEVAALSASGDRRVVRPILLLADEHCALSGVMDQMLSLLEEVDVVDYVRELLCVLPDFNARSPLYSEREVGKLLSSDSDRSVVVAALRGVKGESVAALRAVLDRLDSPRLSLALEEVRRALDAELPARA